MGCLGLRAATSRLFGGCFLHFFCFCRFFKIVVVRRTLVARFAHVFFAAMSNALLLGVNVGVKAGGFCRHHWLSKWGRCMTMRMLPFQAIH